jgi:transposase
MDVFSISLLQPLVNRVYLGWRRLGRLPAAALWWLWLATIVVHLLCLGGDISFPSEGATTCQAEAPVLSVSPSLGAVLQGTGWLLLLVMVRRSNEASPFPWLRYRVRWVVRRRRLADLSFEELLAALPPGVRPIAQLVDWLTRSQIAKLLCAIPVLYPILAELEVEKIIDKYCPTEAEVNLGAVVLILCLNRLVAPRPLSGVADWAAKTVIEEYTGVPASKLNDDRLGRALDAIYPHLEDIWAEIVGRALVRYEIDLSLVFYDLTTFYFEGEYRQNQAIVLGHSRPQRGKKQRKLALNVTGQEKFPFLYQLLDGNVADVSTVQANMQRLSKVLREQGWPVDAVLVVGDRAMLSAAIVRAYHRANLKYLGALKVMGEKEKALIRGVSEEQLQAHRLDETHYGVERCHTFEIRKAGWSVTERALVVLSRVLRRQKRKRRAQQIRERVATLQLIATERLNRRKYKRRAYAWEQIQKQVLNQPGGKFLRVVLAGEDGTLRLSWEIDVGALREAMVLDGKFILVTNDRRLSRAEMVTRYGEKDKVEKSFRTVKGPLRLRPVFLHKEERIAGLVFVNMLALLVYSVVEMKCRRAGLMITTETVLKRFAYLALIYTTFVDGSVQVRREPLNRRQREVTRALGEVWWPVSLGGAWPALPERPAAWQRVPEKVPLPAVV